MTAVTLTDVKRGFRRENFSLLFVMLLAGGCGSSHGGKPGIPASVSPGWKLASFEPAAAPSGIPGDGAPACWKGMYGGQGSAEVWVCGYKTNAGAFDAVQRARAEAQAVKFQEGKWLVLVKWNDVPKTSLTALIR